MRAEQECVYRVAAIKGRWCTVLAYVIALAPGFGRVPFNTRTQINDSDYSRAI
jgi:hypothetical protein